MSTAAAVLFFTIAATAAVVFFNFKSEQFAAVRALNFTFF